jgi:hypothetical protein
MDITTPLCAVVRDRKRRQCYCFVFKKLIHTFSFCELIQFYLIMEVTFFVDTRPYRGID